MAENILEKIIQKKNLRIKSLKESISLDSLNNSINTNKLFINFKQKIESNIKENKYSIIAEIKKASPSAGIISENFDPVLKSKEYESFGASALSILTEEDYFLGNIQYLMDVKATTSLPILRKDFIVDEYQIYESKLIGADCILLIASILNDEELKNFSEIAERLKLDYIIEVHDEEELQRVQHFSNAIIGVNNRNLKTFDVDINNSVELKKIFEGENIFIAESGIKSKKDIEYLKQHNINVFLIGESLMKGDFFET